MTIIIANKPANRLDFVLRLEWNLCRVRPLFHVSLNGHEGMSDRCRDPSHVPHCALYRPIGSWDRHIAPLWNCPVYFSQEFLRNKNIVWMMINKHIRFACLIHIAMETRQNLIDLFFQQWKLPSMISFRTVTGWTKWLDSIPIPSLELNFNIML